MGLFDTLRRPDRESTKLRLQQKMQEADLELEELYQSAREANKRITKNNTHEAAARHAHMPEGITNMFSKESSRNRNKEIAAELKIKEVQRRKHDLEEKLKRLDPDHEHGATAPPPAPTPPQASGSHRAGTPGTPVEQRHAHVAIRAISGGEMERFPPKGNERIPRAKNLTAHVGAAVSGAGRG